jgi:hypothetical protein
LKTRSPTFQFLSRFIGPRFQAIRETRLDPAEVAKAKGSEKEEND